MGRRCSLVLGALALAVAATACSGGGSSGATSSTAVTFAPAGQSGPTSTPSQTATSPSSAPPSTAPPATLPSSVEPGTGVLVVGASSVTVGITLCTFTPETDASTGITTNVLVTGDDGKGGTLSISQRQTAGGGGTTTTETVTYSRGGSTVESSRIAINGTYHDLRDGSAHGPLLVVEGDVVRASGTFGSPGSAAGDPSLATGAVLARCPPP